MRLVATPARFVRRFAAGLVLAALSGMQMAVAAPATAAASGVNADRDRDGDGVVDSLDAFPFDPTRTLPIDGVSATVDRQILVALTPEDTAAANPFDLHGRTLVFTPDGNGGYARDVRALAWEEDLGPAVADGAVIELGGLGFAFAGRRWDAFHVSRHGLLTFGGPLAYRYWDAENRFDTMTEIAGKLIDVPTISPLYKPMLGGRTDRYGAAQHVARRPDRVVVTWITTEPDYYVQGVPPERPTRFQAVLGADGSIRFNYADVHLGDGIVGLFTDEGVIKGELVGSVVDGVDAGLPGHLDLLEAAIYESNTDAVILEFTTRDPIPDPPAGTVYSYRLYFDTDRPWWTYADFSDEDFAWLIDVLPGGVHAARGRGVRTTMPTDAGNRIALLADIRDFEGIPATVIADAAQFDDGRFVRGNLSSPVLIQLPTVSDAATDLSQSDQRFTRNQREVFHHRSLPDLDAIACRVIGVLGDAFDLFVFHNEFRIDSQESGTPWTRYGANVGVQDVGDLGRHAAPCGARRLKGRWVLPVWMRSDHVFQASPGRREDGRYDRGLLLFAHEFIHAWTVYVSYLRDGAREPLFGNYCRCHWRTDLHIPAAFPWHADEAGPRSLMGGRYWRANGDGTFTPLDGYWNGGPSWLDLYAMGLADASEVPDMFILRNLRPVRDGDPYGPHTGNREIVTIEQVVAAEGPRIPSAAEAQKNFNAGFVYLLEPGRKPTGELLRLHTAYRDQVQAHWRHVTGERSRITTFVSRGPALTPEQEERYNETWRILTDAAAGSTAAGAAPFTDHPIRPGTTPLGTVHLRELRERIAALRAREALPAVQWTDPTLVAGVTPVRRVHLTELRAALDAVYDALARPRPSYTDAAVTAGVTVIKAVHLTELRAAVEALEQEVMPLSGVSPDEAEIHTSTWTPASAPAEGDHSP